MRVRATAIVIGILGVSHGLVPPLLAEDVPFTVIKVPRPATPAKSGKPIAKRLKNYTLVVPGPGGLHIREDVPVTDPYTTIGRGYDPITQQVLDKECVIAAQGAQDQPLQGTIKDQNKGVFSSENGYAKAGSTSVGVSAIIKAVKLGFGTSSASASSFNSVDQSGRVYYSVATEGSERRNVQWTTRAKHLLETNQIGLFLRECGTRYVRAVYKGHLLDTTVTYQLRENQHSTSSATSLSIGVKDIFEVSGSSANAQATVSQIARLNFTNHGLGRFAVPQPPKAAAPPGAVETLNTDPAKPEPAPAPSDDKPAEPGTGTSGQAGASTGSPQGPSKIDQLLTWYENGFETAVQADLDAQPAAGQTKKNSALPLYATLDLYADKDLPLRERIPTWPGDVFKAVSDKANLYNDLVTAIADANSVITIPPNTRLNDFYDGETADTVRAKRDAARMYLVSFQDAVTACGDYIVAAKPKAPTGEDVVVACKRQLDTLTETKVKSVQLKRKFEDPPAPAQVN